MITLLELQVTNVMYSVEMTLPLVTIERTGLVMCVELQAHSTSMSTGADQVTDHLNFSETFCPVMLFMLYLTVVYITRERLGTYVCSKIPKLAIPLFSTS